jgi:alpha-D-xyloside xylohydrolase
LLVEHEATPQFKLERNDATLAVVTEKMRAVFNLHTGVLQFTDLLGKPFLSEIPGARKLDLSSVQGEPTFVASEAFASPRDERLFGSGEFQDGYLDIRDLPRRLTQVNSQISIPFLLSSKGYGILWHNYGLTDLNPAHEQVVLSPTGAGKTITVDVTSIDGIRKETQQEGEFVGSLPVLIL